MNPAEGLRPSGSPPFWGPGDQIDWIYGRAWGHSVYAHPMTVVRDDADALIAWLPVGAMGLATVRADGRDLRADKSTMFTAERVEVERAWTGSHNLRIHETGRHWSTWLFFDGTTGEFEGWYCNIEEPHLRDEAATYSFDHVLDVWVEPDRTLSRKDEDELVLAVEQRRYTQAEAADITSVADEIEAVVRAWGPPFCDGWETFRPDPAWPVPTLRRAVIRTTALRNWSASPRPRGA